MKPQKQLAITIDRYDLVWEREKLAALDDIDIELIARAPTSADDIVDMAKDADVLMLSSRDHVTREMIDQLPKCAMIGCYSVGYDRVDAIAATEHGIYVSHVPDYCTNEVADHAFSLILALNRRTVELDRSLHDDGWLEHAHFTDRLLRGPVPALRNQTLGIVGFGRIGQAVAKRSKPFGVRVVASDPYEREQVFTASGVERMNLDDLLTMADIVTVHALLNGETRGLLNRRRIGLMKPGASLVNTARGPIVDQDALIDALASGALNGAGIDVTVVEPLPSDSRLYQLPGVILTPHSAYYSEESARLVRNEGLAEAVRVLRGMQPRTIANLEVKPRARLSPYAGPSEPGRYWDQPDTAGSQVA